MNEFVFGFSTGLSLILAIGAQNLFVIEQGIKKNNIFLVTSICILGDFLLIFFGIFLFHFIENFINDLINLLLSLCLTLFLLNFIWLKLKTFKYDIEFSQTHSQTSKSKIALQTLAFTFLNPHVYSDTVFILGNLSKNFPTISDKVLFGLGASLASFIFFYFLGYGAQSLRAYFLNKKIWKLVNMIIISYLLILTLSIIFTEII